MLATLTPRRFLRSNFVDLLVGPHGIDRYLELIRPELTIHDARAEVVSVRRQTARSVTLTLRPNAAWRGFRAGQFVRVGVEIDGVRRTRTYSPASVEGAARELELTVTEHPEGLVSRHLLAHARPGAVLHLGDAQGDFVLPERRPSRLALISGGSGITPVLSMLRTLCAEGHADPVAFIHYARTAADWLYAPEVRALAARHPNVRVAFVATRGEDRGAGVHVSGEAIAAAFADGAGLHDAHAAVCGPPALLEAVQSIFEPERVFAETFTPPSIVLAAGATAEGTLHFTRSGASAPIGAGSLLEQAEGAGLTPAFGCRMGICHTCTCRKTAGPVRNVLTGEISDEEDEDIQLCVSVPAGDVALEI
ncbi:MAG TPA: ferredoxin reductase [Solirubrobacteraceae bacterium]|nr:ferredoxin reductase [Solirubrobacteraceae bacterium]